MHLTASIASYFNCIQALSSELKSINKAIERAVQGLNPVEYQIPTSIRGIGPVYANGILAEMGSVKCIPSNDALAKYSGTSEKKTSLDILLLKILQ